ncbi:MAG: carbon-nitrogen hydrolase family protein [Kiloniellales bacterium]|nr:carbon-nitrogen hydrolase family protein [Kiloniellales bacterium]
MTDSFTVGLIQMTSGRDLGPNVEAASALIREARAQGADFVLTPETTTMMEPRRKLTLEKAAPEAEHDGVVAFAALAAELELWLLIGSMTVGFGKMGDGEKVANRSFLFDPAGRIAARYDKIHMFDVEIPDGQSYRESSTYQAGSVAVTAALPWGILGLSVCYDLRFPQLYRDLAQAGADFLTVPAAFTQFTGQAHWHVLLRARAIETGCFVFAPAQCGEHAEGRRTYGHSLVVAPWGEILAEGGEAPGVVVAEVDTAKIAEARRMVPSLGHDRRFETPAAVVHLRDAGD